MLSAICGIFRDAYVSLHDVVVRCLSLVASQRALEIGNSDPDPSCIFQGMSCVYPRHIGKTKPF